MLHLARFYSLHHERTVNRNNTVTIGSRVLQIQPVSWRHSLAGRKVPVRQHLNGELSLAYGPHDLGRFSARGEPLRKRPAMKKPRGGKASKAAFPPHLEIPLTTRDSHFSTAEPDILTCYQHQCGVRLS
jgi:hypothetical protein